MKLNLEQRTRLFTIVSNTVLVNTDKVDVISFDNPFLSFIYDDDDYEILYNYNVNGFRGSLIETVQISLHDKMIDASVKFDSSDYMFMKKTSDMRDLTSKINDTIFNKGKEITDKNIINKILGIK